MDIRRAGQEDVPGLQRLWIEFMDHHSRLDPDYTRRDDAVTNWSTYLESKFDDESAAVFVAADEKRLLGYIGALVRAYPPVYTLQTYGYIEEIAVTRRFRRQGIGSGLWSAAERWLLSRGVERIKVAIDVANPESRGFFRSRGFVENTETLIRRYR